MGGRDVGCFGNAGGVAGSGVGSRSRLPRTTGRQIRTGLQMHKLASGGSTVVGLEDGGSRVGILRTTAGLGRVFGAQACERRKESSGRLEQDVRHAGLRAEDRG
jgi:hypothetical protein